MSTTTANLGLFKYDTIEDAETSFSIDTALNNNWDIIDTSYSSIDPSNYVSLASLSEAHVITKYSSGNDWYVRFSNGFEIQCSKASVSASAGYEVTLLHQYINNRYGVILTRTAASTTTTSSGYVFTRGMTEGTFEIFSTVGTSYIWTTFGFIA